MNPLIRRLAFMGATVLASFSNNPQGSSAAEPTALPIYPAVIANNQFAFTLYGKLAAEAKGKNLFFSPYSMSTALAMTAEGARGETALQMGQALGYPVALKEGATPQQPWRLWPIHSGFAAIDARFRAAQQPVPERIRVQIDALQAQLKSLNEKVEKLQEGNDFNGAMKVSSEGKKVAEQLNQLLTTVDRFELRAANALWGEKTYPFAPKYLEVIKKNYASDGAFEADFVHEADAVRGKINAWVEKQTSDKIKNLLAPGTVTADTRLVLASAIYFKGQWSEDFPVDATADGEFKLADGQKATVPMMHHLGIKVARYGAIMGDGNPFKTPKEITRGTPDGAAVAMPAVYPDDDGAQFLELPYKGGELSMVIMLPRKADGLAALEKRVTSASVQKWLEKMEQRKVEVIMPRYKLETKYEMNEPLAALGMTRAFKPPGPDGADFSGMTSSADPAQRLSISTVIHQAFVEVNEKGTEAAAATAVAMATASFQPSEPFDPVFQADHPFLFLIRDAKTGVILFLGRVNDPRG